MNGNFPHMRPVSAAPGSTDQKQRLAALVERVRQRTGLRCCYDVVRRSLFFHYGHEPDFGVLRLRAVHPDGSERRYDANEIDDAIRFVQLGRMSVKNKDRAAKQHEQREQWAREEETERFLAERRPDAMDYDAFLMRRRRGMMKIISA